MSPYLTNHHQSHLITLPVNMHDLIKLVAQAYRHMSTFDPQNYVGGRIAALSRKKREINTSL